MHVHVHEQVTYMVYASVNMIMVIKGWGGKIFHHMSIMQSYWYRHSRRII